MRKRWWIGAIILVWAIWGGSGDPPKQARTSPPVTQQLAVSYPASKTAQQPRSPTVDASAYLFVTGNRVRLRSGPSTSRSILGHLDRGARVRLEKMDGSWAEVVTSFGGGWMSSKYLSVQKPSVVVEPTPQPKRKVAAPTSREIREARKEIIRQSIASYPGSCPCP
ncbi:SH3 domain-containing protein [Phaeobacter sp. B1627]|uniref:SH3 domain-containing protein n=1 Tax=Phaeobacter sp. B1627 TaxID=2583809 RepID=UPI00111968EE|nr:SH3 domain-containing protein [Phaeobacter sp. B1627]